MNAQLYHELKVAKFDTIDKPNMTKSFIDGSWAEAKRVWVIFGLIQLTYFINKLCSYSTFKLV